MQSYSMTLKSLEETIDHLLCHCSNLCKSMLDQPEFIHTLWSKAPIYYGSYSREILWCVLFYKENVTRLQGALKNC